LGHRQRDRGRDPTLIGCGLQAGGLAFAAGAAPYPRDHEREADDAGAAWPAAPGLAAAGDSARLSATRPTFKGRGHNSGCTPCRARVLG
jgi:hypothetical protein